LPLQDVPDDQLSQPSRPEEHCFGSRAGVMLQQVGIMQTVINRDAFLFVCTYISNNNKIYIYIYRNHRKQSNLTVRLRILQKHETQVLNPLGLVWISTFMRRATLP